MTKPFFIITPYMYKTNMPKKSIQSHSNIIKYQLGWFDNLFQDDNNNNNKEQNTSKDSGTSIDWDLYDTINNQNKEPEDRGTIEVPANAETVIYESPDGETYEIPISDLIEADDDDEIQYTSANNNKQYNIKKKTTAYPIRKIHKTMKQPTYNPRYKSMLTINQCFGLTR